MSVTARLALEIPGARRSPGADMQEAPETVQTSLIQVLDGVYQIFKAQPGQAGQVLLVFSPQGKYDHGEPAGRGDLAGTRHVGPRLLRVPGACLRARR